MICAECGGSGWITVEKNGYSAAKRCGCVRSSTHKREAPTADDCTAAGRMLLKNAPFSPDDVEMRAAVSSWVAASIETRAELQRFMAYALEHMGEWGGIGGLRALLESMRETAAQEIVAAETDQKLLEWKEQAKQLGEAPRPEPLQLEAACKMPEPNQGRRGALAARLNRERTEKREPVREGTLDEAEEQVRQQIESAPKRSEEERDRIIAEMKDKIRRMPA